MNPEVTIKILSDITKAKKGIEQLRKILDGLNRDYKKLAEAAKFADKERQREHQKEMELLRQKGKLEQEGLRAANRLKQEGFKEDNRRRRDSERRDTAAVKKQEQNTKALLRAKERAEDRATKATQKRRNVEERLAKQSIRDIQREITAADRRIRQNETLIKQAQRRADAEKQARIESLVAVGAVASRLGSSVGVIGENIIRGVVGGAVDIERSTDSFRALLGSVEAAEDAIRRIRAIAFLPGIEEGQARRAVRQLIAYNFEIAQADLLTREFGNATALSGSGAHALTEVLKQLGQASRRNRFEQQELNALIEYAPTIFKAYEQYLGATITSGEDFTKAAIAMSGSVKQFVIEATAFAQQNAPRAGFETLANSVSNLKNQLNFAKQELGKQFIPEIRAVSDVLSGLIDTFNKLEPAQQKALGYGVVGGTVAAKSIGPLAAFASDIGILLAVLAPAKLDKITASLGKLIPHLGKLGAIAGKGAAVALTITDKGHTPTESELEERGLEGAIRNMLRSQSSGDFVGTLRAFKDLERWGGLRQPSIANTHQFPASQELSRLLVSLNLQGREDEIARLFPLLQGITTKPQVAQLRGLGLNRNTLSRLRTLFHQRDIERRQAEAAAAIVPEPPAQPTPAFNAVVKATAPVARKMQQRQTSTAQAHAIVSPQAQFQAQQTFIDTQRERELQNERQQKRKIDGIRMARAEAQRRQQQETHRQTLLLLEDELAQQQATLERILASGAVSDSIKRQRVQEYQRFLDNVNEERFYKDRQSGLSAVEAELNDKKRQREAAQTYAAYQARISDDTRAKQVRNLQLVTDAYLAELAKRQRAEEEAYVSMQQVFSQVNALFNAETQKLRTELDSRRAQWETYFSYINRLNFDSTNQFLNSIWLVTAEVIKAIAIRKAAEGVATGNIPQVVASIAVAGGASIAEHQIRQQARTEQQEVNRARIFHNAQNDMFLQRSVGRAAQRTDASGYAIRQAQRRNAQDATNIVVNALKQAQGTPGQKEIVLNITQPIIINDRIIDELFETHRTRVDLGLAVP